MPGRGRPIKHEKPRKKVTLGLDPDVVYESKVQAAIEERPLSEIVDDSLRAYLKSKKR